MRNIGQTRVEQHLRDLRGFAGTGRRDEHEPIAGTEGFKNLRMDLPDGKGSVHGHCAPTTWTFNQDGGGKAALPLGGYSQAFEATHLLDPSGSCSTLHRSAELYSAVSHPVSQSCTLPGDWKFRSVGPIRHSAEYNSAIRQIENLRYTLVPDTR